MATATKTPKTPAKTTEAPACLCGCGEKTGGGRFRPGHDARFKGVLQRRNADGTLTAADRTTIKTLGWERFVFKAEESATTSKLTIPQLNILRLLAKAPSGLTRPDLNRKLGVTLPMNEHLGPVAREDVAEVEEAIGRKTLLGLRYVTATEQDVDGRDVTFYRITANGKKAIA